MSKQRLSGTSFILNLSLWFHHGARGRFFADWKAELTRVITEANQVGIASGRTYSLITIVEFYLHAVVLKFGKVF